MTEVQSKPAAKKGRGLAIPAILCTCFCLLFSVLTYAATDLGTNGHYITQGGSPWLYLGDTEWLLNSFSDGNITQIISDRASKGFTVIQVWSQHYYAATFGAEKDYYGQLPFVNDKVTQFNAPYWQRWQWIADKCAQYGLHLAIHIGDPILGLSGRPNAQNNAEAYEYGRQVGACFAGRSNVIFNCMGFDADLDYGYLGVTGWRALSEGVADGVNGYNSYNYTADGPYGYTTTFMMGHTYSASPSYWLGAGEPLDVNSSEVWGNPTGIYGRINSDYNYYPGKPAAIVEGTYEDGYAFYPVTPDAHCVRNEAWSVFFAGGAGYAYGHISACTQVADVNYLSSPGSSQMGLLKDFMNNREWWKFIPDQGIIASGSYLAAVKSSDGDECYVYYPYGGNAYINMNRVTTSTNVTATWFDPATGNTQTAGSFTNTQTSVSLTAPWQDAVLCLNASGGITPPSNASIKTDKASYTTGETITVTYSDGPGNNKDWVAIVPHGTDSYSNGYWQYVNGAKGGTQTFSASGLNGSYDAVFYENDGYHHLATSTFTVGGAAGGASIKTDKASYTTGETITVTYSDGPGNNKDWVAIVPHGTDSYSNGYWQYVNGAKGGTMTFSASALNGSYDAVFYENDGYHHLATSTFTVGGAAGGASIKTDKASYTTGETITVTYSDGPGNNKDWVAIVPHGTDSWSNGYWQYVNGAKGGTMTFSASALNGSYDAVFYENDGFHHLATSTFTVSLGKIAVPQASIVDTVMSLQSAPQPFNPSVTISYNVPPRAQSGILSIHAADGRLVKQMKVNGKGSFTWTATGQASGFYLLNFTVGKEHLMKRMLLVK